MCTITLEYYQSNALARRKLAVLLAAGLFVKVENTPQKPMPEEVEAHCMLKKGFLYASKIMSAEAFARHLQ